VRLFVGARISVATANALAGCAETLARRARDAGVDIRWVPPVNYHVTIKFLGQTRDAALAAVIDALVAAAANTPRIALHCARLGAFPSLDKSNVLWAGVSEDAALAELAGRIDRACTALGFAADKRPFHPHVTLGRVRETRPLRDVVLPLSEQMFGDTRIDSVTLFESETKSSGSVYREVRKISFKTAPEAAVSAAERQSRPVELDTTRRTSEPETDDGWPRGQGMPPTDS
jgi:RNA 2',3'-cyclic 3'-phosphodiesterase